MGLLDNKLPVGVPGRRRDKHRVRERPAYRRERDVSVSARGGKRKQNDGREPDQVGTELGQATPPGSMRPRLVPTRRSRQAGAERPALREACGNHLRARARVHQVRAYCRQ